MTRRASPDPIFLGIEAGGTRTVALAHGAVSVRREFGPANLRLLDDRQLERHFRGIAKAMPQPAALAIGMAGARTDADRKRIRAAAARAWPRVPCYATNDLETALMAAEDLTDHPGFRHAWTKSLGGGQVMDGRAADRIRTLPRVLILSGTGSCCFGRTWEGRTAKMGGWGHLLGDKGSGYEIGLRALKATVYYLDRDGEWSALGQRLLRVLQLNEPDELIGWAQTAAKTEIAALAVEVFKAWGGGDRIATDILKGAAAGLAQDGADCARRLVRRPASVHFILAGSVLLRQPRFASLVARQLRRIWPQAIVTPLKEESVRGAVELAEQHFPPATPVETMEMLEEVPASTPGLRSMAQSPTEQRNPASVNLDRLSLAAAIDLMLREDAKILPALRAERRKIEQGVKLIVHSLRRGGRLFYVGAGTSGRLGVLDASECPPTFRTDPEQVQGIIAGGQSALWSAVEGAEDDPVAGGRAMEFRGIGRRDTVVGIAASGRTPFVWGALREAKRRGASTVLLCFNHRLEIPRSDRPTLVLAPKIGPEVLTGSTRLKAGTATKLVLNMFTTLAMVRLGKVLSNLMIDVKATNVKLRDRAMRIVRELTGAGAADAETALRGTEWRIPEACARLAPLRRSSKLKVQSSKKDPSSKFKAPKAAPR